jgi:CheY-like chemotaxis protein/phosphohistidine swiveling domain-containing protein
MEMSRVLVVDDEPGVRKMVSLAFEASGFDVATAGDGADAIVQVELFDPDAVVMDIMMPRLDGLKALGHLRHQPSTSGLPVLLLSAKASPADIAMGRQIGATDYVTKPFETSDLITRTQQAIDQVTSTVVRAGAVVAAGNATLPATDPFPRQAPPLPRTKRYPSEHTPDTDKPAPVSERGPGTPPPPMSVSAPAALPVPVRDLARRTSALPGHASLTWHDHGQVMIGTFTLWEVLTLALVTSSIGMVWFRLVPSIEIGMVVEAVLMVLAAVGAVLGNQSYRRDRAKASASAAVTDAEPDPFWTPRALGRGSGGRSAAGVPATGLLATTGVATTGVTDRIRRNPPNPLPPGALAGIGLGGRTVVGRALVCDDPETALARIGLGDVLVLTNPVPAYNSIAPMVAAIVTDRGGPHSHVAVLARSLGLPAVVDVADAATEIHDGQLIEVDPVAGVVRPFSGGF